MVTLFDLVLSLQEAVKLVWFQYLKHCGYAFIDSQESTSTGVTRYCIYIVKKIVKTKIWRFI